MTFSRSFFDSENRKVSEYLGPETGSLRAAVEWMNEFLRVNMGGRKTNELQRQEEQQTFPWPNWVWKGQSPNVYLFMIRGEITFPDRLIHWIYKKTKKQRC